jgi:predicted DNA-binding protein YlxM (UPF0122 family)
MYKFEFSKKEFEELKEKIYLSDIQIKIIEYRLKDYSITKMAYLENTSESTISREIKKIVKKINKIL